MIAIPNHKKNKRFCISIIIVIIDSWHYCTWVFPCLSVLDLACLCFPICCQWIFSGRFFFGMLCACTLLQSTVP